MNLRNIMLISAVLALGAGTAGAQTWVGYDRTEVRFGANELSFDAFATYADPKRGVFRSRRGEWGGGVAVNYFVTRHLGFSAETYFEDRGDFFDHVSGNVLLRWPIDEAMIAPYLLAGGGRRWDPRSEWYGQIGAGLEARFHRNFGIFADGRRVFREKTSDHVLVRAGLRFAL
jgi:hypothetical protein